MKDPFYRNLCQNPNNYDATIKYLRKHHPTFKEMSPKHYAKHAASHFVNEAIKTLVFEPDYADHTFYFNETGYLIVTRMLGTDKVALSITHQQKD